MLAGREPDADLVGVLDDIDPTTLTGEDLASYVRARWQVHNRAEAQLLAGLRELGTAREGRTVRPASSDEFSGDEVAALLGWSRTMAARRLDLADDLFERLPALGAAMWQGRLDEPKVRAISELTGDLSDDHARFAAAEVLPEAAELPVAALRERLEQIVLDLDPDWAERRRRRAEARGRVLLSTNPSSTATLAFVDAPATGGIASMARIEALAAAVRRRGVLIPINQLRMQVGMRLLDGSTAGMTDDDIAALLAAEYHADGGPRADRTTRGRTTTPTAARMPAPMEAPTRCPTMTPTTGPTTKDPTTARLPAPTPGPTTTPTTKDPARSCRRCPRRARIPRRAPSTSPTCRTGPTTRDRPRRSRPSPGPGGSARAPSRCGCA